MSVFDEIPATSEEYTFGNFVAGRADNSLSVINCSHELYRDSFILAIHRFTQHKNGYYWCQLTINNTLVQPSYRAHFSAGKCNITSYYRIANFNLNEHQCAQHVTTESEAGLTTYELSGVASSTKPTSSSSVTQQERKNNTTVINVATESKIRTSSIIQLEKESDEQIIYAVGGLSALLLITLLGVLVLAFSFTFYVHHLRKKISKLHRSTKL